MDAYFYQQGLADLQPRECLLSLQMLDDLDQDVRTISENKQQFQYGFMNQSLPKAPSQHSRDSNSVQQAVFKTEGYQIPDFGPQYPAEVFGRCQTEQEEDVRTSMRQQKVQYEKQCQDVELAENQIQFRESEESVKKRETQDGDENVKQSVEIQNEPIPVQQIIGDQQVPVQNTNQSNHLKEDSLPLLNIGPSSFSLYGQQHQNTYPILQHSEIRERSSQFSHIQDHISAEKQIKEMIVNLRDEQFGMNQQKVKRQFEGLLLKMEALIDIIQDQNQKAEQQRMMKEELLSSFRRSEKNFQICTKVVEINIASTQPACCCGGKIKKSNPKKQSCQKIQPNTMNLKLSMPAEQLPLDYRHNTDNYYSHELPTQTRVSYLTERHRTEANIASSRNRAGDSSTVRNSSRSSKKGLKLLSTLDDNNKSGNAKLICLNKKPNQESDVLPKDTKKNGKGSVKHKTIILGKGVINKPVKPTNLAPSSPTSFFNSRRVSAGSASASASAFLRRFM